MSHGIGFHNVVNGYNVKVFLIAGNPEKHSADPSKTIDGYFDVSHVVSVFLLQINEAFFPGT